MAEESNHPTAAAWAVHAFTASGAVLALFALLAIVRDRPPAEVLLWLFAALVVDGIDGTLARAARVKERLPRIDGAALDLVIDYLTYVVVPVLLILRSGHFPPVLAVPLAAAILVSSLYVFARRDMKTDDGYFRGFPALWNIVAFYFFVGSPPPFFAAVIAALLVILSFAPVHVVHPFRVRDYGWFLPALSVVWALATAALLLPFHSTWPAMMGVSLASAGVLLALGLWRTARGPRRAQ